MRLSIAIASFPDIYGIYTRFVLDWTSQAFANWVSVITLASARRALNHQNQWFIDAVGLLMGLIVLKTWWRISDTYLVAIGIASSAVQTTLMALSSSGSSEFGSVMFYAGAGAGCLGMLAPSTVISIATVCVEPDEVWRLNAIILYWTFRLAR